MIDFSTLAVICGGFLAGFVGMLLVTVAARLLYGPVRSIGAKPRRFLPGPRHMAILTSVNIFGFGGFLGYLAYSGHFAGRRIWFMVGFFLSIAYVVAFMSFAAWKAKQKRAGAAGVR